MSEQSLSEITDERLGDWAKRLKASNATPLCLVGVGHGDKSGELTVCTTANISDSVLIGILKWVIRGIEAGARPPNEGGTREWKPE